MAVSFEGGAAVGSITLDKPPANSYDFEFMEEMGAAVDAAAADDAVKVVIVRTASKKFFCAGADIKAFLANDTAGNMKMINRGHEALAAIARVPKVFIAQIEGHALGGGLEITLACDLRFGARGSYKLGVPEVTLGLLPGNGGTQRLPRIIGVPKALDLMVTGRAISPGEAHSLGILNRLFAPSETAEKTREYAEQLAGGRDRGDRRDQADDVRGGGDADQGRAGARARRHRTVVWYGGRPGRPERLRREAQGGVPRCLSARSTT